jgi:hypothetical protein
MQAATEAVVDTLGVPATWTQTKSPNATADVVVGFRTLGYADEALINAYGIGAKVLTIKVSAVAVVDKFDRITVGPETYTIDAVMPVHLNGVHLFHKCYVKGK